MNIIVGSSSESKQEAVRQACKRLNLDMVVWGVRATSGQNAQPVGTDETYNGAMNRAKLGLKASPHDIAIGIESGIFRLKEKDGTTVTYDKALVVIITSKEDLIVVQSDKVELPEEYVTVAEKRGFATTTVGSIVAEKLGGNPTDPHLTLSKGAISRTTLLKNAVVKAISMLPRELLAPSS